MSAGPGVRRRRRERCCRVLGQISCKARQKPSAPSPVASSGSSTSPFWSRSRSRSTAPALGAFPEAVFDRQQLLAPLGVGADEDQDALPLVLEPGREVNAVSPEIDVAPGQEIASLPAFVFVLPCSRQAAHGRRRQAWSIGTEQRRQSFLELAGRDALQVEPSMVRRPSIRSPEETPPGGGGGGNSSSTFLVRRR